MHHRYLSKSKSARYFRIYQWIVWTVWAGQVEWAEGVDLTSFLVHLRVNFQAFSCRFMIIWMIIYEYMIIYECDITCAQVSLPMTCTEFDADEIKRLGKRFKKLVKNHRHCHLCHRQQHYLSHCKCHRNFHRHQKHDNHSGPRRVRVAVNRGVYVVAGTAAKSPCPVLIFVLRLTIYDMCLWLMIFNILFVIYDLQFMKYERYLYWQASDWHQNDIRDVGSIADLVLVLLVHLVHL